MTLQPARPGIRKIRAYMTEAEDDGLPAPDLLLNSNESVFGPSPKAIEAAREATGHLERYTENIDGTLAPEIASFFGVDAAKITVGNGSDDLLARLARIYLGPGTEMLRSEIEKGEKFVQDDLHAQQGTTGYRFFPGQAH